MEGNIYETGIYRGAGKRIANTELNAVLENELSLPAKNPSRRCRLWDVSVEAFKEEEHPAKQEYSFSYTYHFSRTSVFVHHKEERRLFYEDTDDQFQE